MLNKLKYPSIKTMFLPDPGYTIFDIDFAQADARVVAWESKCTRLMKIFNTPGADIHDENCKDFFGELTPRGRQTMKGGVHAVNYYVKANTLAGTLGTPRANAQAFIERWFTLNPEIEDWHESVKNQLYSNGTIHNIFGFRMQYFDRIERLLPEALAWTGQSTVAIAIKLAMNNLMLLDKETGGDIQVLNQVHDSILGQFRSSTYPWMRQRIHDAMMVPIPYPEPLYLPVDMKASRKSWGHCQHIAGWKGGKFHPWTDNQKFCIH